MNHRSGVINVFNYQVFFEQLVRRIDSTKIPGEQQNVDIEKLLTDDEFYEKTYELSFKILSSYWLDISHVQGNIYTNERSSFSSSPPQKLNSRTLEIFMLRKSISLKYLLRFRIPDK